MKKAIAAGLLLLLLLLIGCGGNTGATTVVSLNKIVYVDGQKYALSASGVQAALNAACNGTAPGAVLIHPGTISLGRTGLIVPNNCDVGGWGQDWTTLTLSSSAATSHFFNASNNATNIRIHDMTLDGGGGMSVSEGCITMNKATSPSDITVERVTCQNAGASAFNVTGTAASPGQRIKFLSNRIINAGLATGSTGQLYGILVSFNSHVVVSDNEIAGGAVTTGISAFSSINPSAASPIVDIQIIGNRIRDLPFHTTPGGAIDIGRARQAVVSNNIISNVAQGACVLFEAVWDGSISGNSCMVTDTVLTGGPIVVKTPDTTQLGEVASQDISITHNSIDDNSAAATTNADIGINGAQSGITIANNTISHLNQQMAGGSPIFLQLGTDDANINAASQNFCNMISVTGNTIVNRPGSSGANDTAISLVEMNSNCVPDHIVIASNTAKGFMTGVGWSACDNNGLTHVYIYNNAVEGNRNGIDGDGRSYATVFYWNNPAPPGGGGLASNFMPPETFFSGGNADGLTP